MQPKVSIVVPIYKVPEQFLRHSIESCIGQTLKDIEIILVDDGSPDDCGKICDEYAQKDTRVKVIHKENGGLSSARNTGQDAAIGESLMFLDGDDFIDEKCCEETYTQLVQNDVQVVLYGETFEYGNSSKISCSFGNQSYLLTKEQTQNLQARVLKWDGGVATAYMKLIRREFLVDHNIRHIDNLRQGAEGYVFCIQLFRYVTKVFYLAKPYYHYIHNNQSICHVSTDKNNELILGCFDYIFNYIKHQDNSEKLKPICLTRFLYIIVTVAISGYFNPAIERTYTDRVNAFKTFINKDLPSYAIKHADRANLDLQRKIILKMIDFRLYFVVYCIACIRRKQLENK